MAEIIKKNYLQQLLFNLEMLLVYTYYPSYCVLII